MLIINADDWGGWPAATGAILRCHQHGRISSVSAMVFMADSERAARLARENGVDAGLHINFSQPFTSAASQVPGLAGAHGRIMRFLRASRYALIFYQPFLRREFRFVFEAQCREFIRLYGRSPAHYDGHQHLHLCTNMLLDRILPEGERVRRSFSFSPGEKGAINRAYRRWVDSRLTARHRLTDYFFSLSQQLDWDGMSRVVDLARSASVELMVHPEWIVEQRFLMSDEYRAALVGLESGFPTVV